MVAIRQNSLKGAARDFGTIQNIMAYVSDQGPPEIPDQAKWMQFLAPVVVSLAGGKEVVAEIGASLQIVKIGVSSINEAANNFENLLTKIFARDTQKQPTDLGIDLRGSIASYKAAGIFPIGRMLSVTKRCLNAKSPETPAGFRSTVKIENDTTRDGAFQALAKNFGLSDVFADMQVMTFIRPILANMDRYREVRINALRTTDSDLFASAYDQRLKSPPEVTKVLIVSSRSLAITLDDQLAPSFISPTQELPPLIQGTKHRVTTHPQFANGAFKLISALLTIKIVTVGLKLGLDLLIPPFVNVWRATVLLRANWHRLTTTFGEGGKLHWLITGFNRLTSGGLKLNKAPTDSLVRGFMSAVRAVLRIGRALMMNPIGLVITAVATAAYPIYRNWRAISGWSKQHQADAQKVFDGDIVGTSKLLINWSPAGLLYKAFTAVLKYLGVTLPVGFTDFGGHLIDGLINGIESRQGSFKSSVAGMDNSISSRFKQRWADIQEAFDGDVVGTGELPINWSPAGLLYKVSTAVLKYFGVTLPTKFTSSGGHLIDGLINGIKNKWGSLKSSVTGMGNSISS